MTQNHIEVEIGMFTQSAGLWGSDDDKLCTFYILYQSGKKSIRLSKSDVQATCKKFNIRPKEYKMFLINP